MMKTPDSFVAKLTARFSSSLITGAMLATCCTGIARADDKMMGGPMDHTMSTPMSADDQKMVSDHIDKMKMMAADPAQSEQMKMDMAKMMVVDHMAMQMSMDPTVKQSIADAMSDPAMKKLHDDAKAMADNPDQMKKMQADIMADPAAMKMVTHEAMMMTMMHEHMGEPMGGMKHDMNDDKK